MASAVELSALCGAGVLAGVVGTAGGITSLVSYPALLAIGMAPLPATLANVVAVTACLPGSLLSSKTELSGRGATLMRLSVLAACGAAIGALLLLVTSDALFARIVPFLLVLAALALLGQRRLSSALDAHPQRSRRILRGGIFGTSLYSAYFGAGAGVMTLVLTSTALDRNYARANAAKNVLLGVASIVAATAFACFGHIDWTAAGVLALGMFFGSTLGPHVARRVPAKAIRILASCMAIALAIELWINPS